jgi:predicted GH43/DUF377 family glycosyl hydrolase
MLPGIQGNISWLLRLLIQTKEYPDYRKLVLKVMCGNPRRIIGHHAEILVPEADFEREGFVPEVVFPTGVVECGDTVLVYYGAADSATAVVEWRICDLLP